jgi:hypothetical protein
LARHLRRSLQRSDQGGSLSGSRRHPLNGGMLRGMAGPSERSGP